MITLDVPKLDSLIARTGFPLEYDVQQMLEKHGWKVLSNRYYVDDVKGIEREIDLVASKSICVDGNQYTTNLIISCKKSDTQLWTFLTADTEASLAPLEMVSGGEAIRYLQEREPNTIKSIADSIPEISTVLQYDREVRGYRQLDRANYADKDSKQIYDSIITTIKASNYEQEHLRGKGLLREDAVSVYFLLSIFGGDMAEKNLASGEVRNINNIKYVNRHIIGGIDRYFCVDFIDFSTLEDSIEKYDRAADMVPKFAAALQDTFYHGILASDSDRAKTFWPPLERAFLDALHDHYEYDDVYGFAMLACNTSGVEHYLDDNGLLHLRMDMSLVTDTCREDMIHDLNTDPFCHELMGRLLKKHFRFDGSFVFERNLEKEQAFDDFVKYGMRGKPGD